MAGFIRVLAGAGKVKNAAVLGLALRAVGFGHRVYLARFLRPWAEEEWQGLAHLDGQVIFRQFAERDLLTNNLLADPFTALGEIIQAIKSQNYPLVILDEANVAACLGLLSIPDLLALIEITPERVELVLTGNCPDPRIIWQADSVTTFQEIKNNEKGYV
ncbi:MAG: cob(I)yrinic acid a,c-diamide adenosyltransferase [Thermodesulfobacteriota bacterium]